MLSRLWGWIAAAFAMMGAALIYVGGQRNRAREAADSSKAQVKAQQRARDIEKSARMAQEDARKAAQQTRRENEARDSSTRPSGSMRRD